MHQFVQSAIEAAKQGDNAKAMAFLKQVLNANPNDVDAWLVLAAVVDDPQRKRQCLKRVLTLDPVNMVAREELEDMDRAEMGYPADTFGLTQDGSAPASTASYEPEKSSSYYSYDPSAFEPEPVIQTPPPTKTPPQTPAPAKKAAKTSSAQTGKKQVFKYSLYVRIMLYGAAVFCGFIGAMMLTQNMLGMGLAILGSGILILILVMVLLPVAEINDKGIQASGFFSSGEATWDEIVKIKSNHMKSRLELTKRNKKVLNISTQLSGYAQIVEILRQKRPDLFGMAPKSQTPTNAFLSTYDDGASADYGNVVKNQVAGSGYKGSRTFKKGFFRQYGLIFIGVPFCLCALATTVQDPAHRIGAAIATFFLTIGIFMPFFQVGAVKVQSNKLSISTFFGTKEFTAQEVRSINIKSARKRYGQIVNFVSIHAKGKDYDLDGFPEGVEIMYGALTNWLEANRRG